MHRITWGLGLLLITAVMSSGTARAQTTSSGSYAVSLPGIVAVAGGFVSIGNDTIAIPGAKNVSITIEWHATSNEPLKLGTAGWNCKKVNQKLTASLEAGGSVGVLLAYDQIDGATGKATHVTKQLKSPPVDHKTSAPPVSVCLR